MQANKIALSETSKKFLRMFAVIKRSLFATFISSIAPFNLLRHSFNFPDINGELQKTPRFECDCFLRQY